MGHAFAAFSRSQAPYITPPFGVDPLDDGDAGEPARALLRVLAGEDRPNYPSGSRPSSR